MTTKFDINNLRELRLNTSQMAFLCDSMKSGGAWVSESDIHYVEDSNLGIQICYNNQTDSWTVYAWEHNGS